MAKDARVGFENILVLFELQSSAAPEKLQKLIELTERYCVVFQTLAQPPALALRLG